MRLMMLTLLTVLGVLSEARSEVIISVDQTEDLQQVLTKYCPWISSVEKVAVMEKTALGMGGDIGGWLSDIASSSEVFTKLEVPLPVGIEAVVLDPAYWNNNGQAEIIIGSVALTDRDGSVKTSPLSEETKTLSQRRAGTGETLLVCFEQQENIVALVLEVGTRNVDGSRPDLGMWGLRETFGVKNTQP